MRSLVGELIRDHLPSGRAKNEKEKKKKTTIKLKGEETETEVYREREWKNTKGGGRGVEWKKDKRKGQEGEEARRKRRREGRGCPRSGPPLPLRNSRKPTLGWTQKPQSPRRARRSRRTGRADAWALPAAPSIRRSLGLASRSVCGNYLLIS